MADQMLLSVRTLLLSGVGRPRVGKAREVAPLLTQISATRTPSNAKLCTNLTKYSHSHHFTLSISFCSICRDLAQEYRSLVKFDTLFEPAWEEGARDPNVSHPGRIVFSIDWFVIQSVGLTFLIDFLGICICYSELAKSVSTRSH